MSAAPSGTTGGIARLVERQMRNWEIARQQSGEGGAPKSGVYDFVTVSRYVGAGGGEFAVRLAERLGWPLFDREILHAMAGDDDLRRSLYAAMDERDLSWVEEAFRALTQTEYVRNDYIHELTRTILALARQGRAVFLGRAADLILPRNRGFRVRVVAPVNTCVQRYAQLRHLDLDEARRQIAQIERQRAAFIHNHFRVDAGDPTRHDLVVNLHRLTLSDALEIVLAAMARCGIGPAADHAGSAGRAEAGRAALSGSPRVVAE